MHHLLSQTCGLGFGLILICAAMNLASAQETQPTEQQAPAAPSSTENKSLLDELGKLLKAPADLLPSLSKPDAPKPDAATPSPPPAAPAIAAPATPPTDAPPAAASRLFPGMVTGREPCPRSANGAPDCQAGSDRLCQSKGYKNGKSLNTDSAFSCSARQARESGKPCGNEHFVTSAFCN